MRQSRGWRGFILGVRQQIIATKVGSQADDLGLLRRSQSSDAYDSSARISFSLYVPVALKYLLALGLHSCYGRTTVRLNGHVLFVNQNLLRFGAGLVQNHLDARHTLHALADNALSRDVADVSHEHDEVLILVPAERAVRIGDGFVKIARTHDLAIIEVGFINHHQPFHLVASAGDREVDSVAIRNIAEPRWLVIWPAGNVVLLSGYPHILDIAQTLNESLVGVVVQDR